MSAAENKAVFLSYASQDAEAALRLCSGLRAAGVEVWFDQSELVGGDAWDAKIRKQIKECALFVPIISAATQARGEGYFRLEWKLAVDRSHLMAHDQAFLLPVVIDATPDPVARVPAEFRAVQWTRLPGGDTPVRFGERVKALLGGEPGARSLSVAAVKERPRATAVPSRRPAGRFIPIFGTLTLVALGIGGWFALRPAADIGARHGGNQAKGSTTALSEAQQLVAKIAIIVDKEADATRVEWNLAETMGAQAVKMEPGNAEAWAAYAQAALGLNEFYTDRARSPLPDALKRSQHALSLAPNSDEAKLALADCYGLVTETRAEAETLLRELTTRHPDDRRMLRALAAVVRGKGSLRDVESTSAKSTLEEALSLYERAAALPGGDPAAWREMASVLIDLRRYPEAEAALDRSLSLRRGPSAVVRKMMFLLIIRHDVAQACQMAEALPGSYFLREDIVEWAATAWLWQGNADRCLRVVNGWSDEFISGAPKGFLTAQAHRLLQRPDAARRAWQEALVSVEGELADPDIAYSNKEAYWLRKAHLHGLLGETAAGEETLRLWEQSSPPTSRRLGYAAALLALGKPDRVIDILALAVASNSRTRADGRNTALGYRAFVRFDPEWKALRGNPRFDALVAGIKSPMETVKPVTATTPGDAAVAPDPKSVAVLAFANLSDDPAQEYFSDGISDEILNALMNERDLRVPGRTSSFSFKKSGLMVPAIARALNVAQVVEGSVKKSGNTVRITATLTRAQDGFSEPIVAFTEELVDTFAIQEKVARAVVEKITRRTGGLETVGSTRNAAAHDAFLRGTAARNGSYSGLEAVAHFETAVRMDPDYALAWARLAQELLRQRQRGVAFRTAENATQARTAAATALRLKPALPEAHLAHALVRQAVDRDLDAASRALDEAERLRPRDAEVWAVRADLTFCRGNWGADLVRLVGRALEADPQNQAQHMSLASFLSVAGWFGDAHRILQRWRVAMPDSESPLRFEADNTVRWTGDVGTALRALETFPPDQRGDRFHATRAELHLQRGDLPAARADFEQVNPAAAESVQQGTRLRHSLSYRRAVLESRLGHVARAAELFEQTLREAEEMAGDGTTARIAVPALVKARLGQRAEALALMEQAMERAKSFFANNVMYVRQSKAEMHAVLGEIDEATAALRIVHETGLGLGYSLRLDAEWEPLRGNAKFQALMNEAEARANAQPKPSK